MFSLPFNLLNHNPAKAALGQLSDPLCPIRIVLISGEEKFGKTTLLRWFLKSISDREPVHIDLAANIGLEGILDKLTEWLSEHNYALTNLANAEAAEQLGSVNASVSNITIQQSQGIRIENTASSEVAWSRARQRALALKKDLATQTRSQPIFVVFDEIDKSDAAVARFLNEVLLNLFSSLDNFHIVFAGRKIENFKRTASQHPIGDVSISVQLMPVTDPKDVITYVGARKTVLAPGLSLADWATQAIERCGGNPQHLIIGLAMILSE